MRPVRTTTMVSKLINHATNATHTYAMDVQANNTYQSDNKSKQTKWTYLLLSLITYFFKTLHDCMILVRTTATSKHIYKNPFKNQNPMTSNLTHYTKHLYHSTMDRVAP